MPQQCRVFGPGVAIMNLTKPTSNGSAAEPQSSSRRVPPWARRLCALHGQKHGGQLQTYPCIFCLRMSKRYSSSTVYPEQHCETRARKSERQISQMEWEPAHVARPKESITRASSYIDDTARFSTSSSAAKGPPSGQGTQTWSFINQIDYLQAQERLGHEFGRAEQEVSMISRSLKQLAKEESIPIVALSQLNVRRVARCRLERRQASRFPTSASRAIEQDADICASHPPSEFKSASASDGAGNDITRWPSLSYPAQFGKYGTT